MNIMKHPIAVASLTTVTALAGLAAYSTAPVASPVNDFTPTSAGMPAEPATEPSAEMAMARCVETEHLGAIFAPGTDPEVVARVSELIHQIGVDRFSSDGTRWPGAINTPVTITYSFPSDGITVFDGINGGTDPNSLNATLTGIFGSEAAWKSQFAAIFQDWSDITGNVYVEVSDDDAPMGSSGPLHGGAGRGDLRITAIPMDGGSGVLAYNYFPGAGDGGDMVLDEDENWGNPTNGLRFFRNILSHEHGHGMGLGHVCPAVGIKLMEPFLNTAFDGPQHDDIRGATHLYGDFYEPNNNAASAGFIKSHSGPGSEPFTLVNMALRDGSDDDYYTFSVDGPGSIDVNVEIVGDIYENNGQDASCAPTGIFFDSFVKVDPDLAVLDVDGSSVLASVDANGLGGDESLAGVVLPAAGTYYIRVQSVVANGAAQIYDLTGSVTIDAVGGGCIADLNGDMIVDTADLGIIINNFGTPGPAGDLNGDMIVNTADLGTLIGVFGTCTPL
jgi:hypothetical protein